MRTRSPAASERAQSSPASGSTPKIFAPGHSAVVAAAARAGEEHVNRARGLDQLERGRAGAGHDVEIVVGRDRREAALLAERVRADLAVLGVAVVGDDLGTVAARRLDLGGRGVERHQDGRLGVVHLGGERDRLGVVARRPGAHAARALGRAQARDRVVGAAELEGAAALQVLGFEEHRRAGARIERARGDDRGLVRDAVEPARRGADAVKVKHGPDQAWAR